MLFLFYNMIPVKNGIPAIKQTLLFTQDLKLNPPVLLSAIGSIV